MALRMVHYEAHLSAQQIETGQDTRVFEPHEHQRRAPGPEAPSGQRPQTVNSINGRGSSFRATPPVSHANKMPLVPPSLGKGQARFTKADRILRRRDFQAAQARGKRLHTAHFGVCLAPGPTDHPRLGLVVTRRLGKAVQRNRVKRLVREFFRRHKLLLPAWDIVVMAKKGAAGLSYEQVREELAPILLPETKNRHDD